MKENTKEISNELLNAYLDNELDGEERAEIMAALENDKLLSGRLCELRNIKELTQLAYNSPNPEIRNKRTWRFGKQYASMAVAASVFLIIGALVGWFAHDESMGNALQSGGRYIASGNSIRSLQDITTQKKVILHIDTAEPDKLLTALDSAEDLLVTSANNGNPIELEIIANSKGLDLLRVGTTPHAERIAELSRKYDNLSILACNRAIKRLEELGIKVDLVPEAKIAPSALEQIVNRLKQGWVYIKV